MRRYNGFMPSSLVTLNREIVQCVRCPRLVAYREQIGREKRRAYRDCDYWARPVPGFGDPSARVLVLGLAPGAHGSNRTGRPFTGDASGKFMYPILHKVGFASQPNADHRDDGLRLLDCYITAAVRCAPPDNKPLLSELANCASFLDRELALLRGLKVVVALGKIGFDAYLAYLKRNRVVQSTTGLRFGHGVRYLPANGITLLASYHPSNQNTATGKLTAPMFEAVFREAKKLAENPGTSALKRPVG
jgi:uracil-DNA glycosylase family 4